MLKEYLISQDVITNETVHKKQPSSTVNAQELANALLAEVRLLRSSFCANLIQSTLASRVPLVTKAALPTNAMCVADCISDWRKMASGEKVFIDPTTLGKMPACSVIDSACKTTDRLVQQFMCGQS